MWIRMIHIYMYISRIVLGLRVALCTCIRIHVCVYVYIYIYANMYTQLYVLYVYVYMYIHLYSCRKSTCRRDALVASAVRDRARGAPARSILEAHTRSSCACLLACKESLCLCVGLRGAFFLWPESAAQKLRAPVACTCVQL